jgi:hypothetical protein
MIIVDTKNGFVGNGGYDSGGGPVPGPTSDLAYHAETITYTDSTHKVFGPLDETPYPPGATALVLLGGVMQEYGVDFTAREVGGGSAPGWYLCVGTGSTAPGGGSFIGGTNPGTGIDSLLVVGDKAVTMYPYENV